MTRRRVGYALIELLVVMAVWTVMMALCAGLIHLLLKLDRSGRTASENAADLSRLARDFRADAHAARPGSVTLAPDRLTLALEPGRTVDYQVRPDDILRTLREGEKVRRFEVYRRPSRTAVRLEVEKEGPRPFASLVLDRPPDGREDSFYQDYRIEAELGKDHRLNSRPE